jgi:hypothetical protein
MRKTMTGKAFQKHTVGDFAKYELPALYKARFMANLCIRTAREGLEERDERAPKALAHYLEERAVINGALRAKKYPDGPPAQQIDLKALSVTGDASKRRSRPDPVADFIKLWEKSNG